MTIRECGCVSSFARFVLRELRLRHAVTHSAKSRQSTESHFNLKHRPVGVGSAEPTNHVPRDDVTPFHVRTNQQARKDCKTKLTAATGKDIHVFHRMRGLFQKEEKEGKDDQFWSVFSSSFQNLCNFRFWFLLLGQKFIARAFERSQEREEQTRRLVPLPSRVWSGDLSKPCGVSTDAAGGRSGCAIVWRHRCPDWLLQGWKSPPTERHLQTRNHHCDASLNIHVLRNIGFLYWKQLYFENVT